jgi:hypothetical protein
MTILADAGVRAVYGVSCRSNFGIVVSNLTEAWMFYCVCCVLVGSGLCDELITRSEEPYRIYEYVCLIVCDLETSRMRRPRPELGFWSQKKKKKL